MMLKPLGEKLTILFGVTSSQSLTLLGSIPDELADNGWNVHVVANFEPRENRPDLKGINFHHVSMVRGPSVLRDLHSLRQWLRVIAGVRPRVLSLGTPKAALLGLIAGKILRVPHRIYHLRGLRLETARGFQKAILYVAEWLTQKSATNILVVSQSLRDEYLRRRLSRKSRLTVIGLGSSHGVDTAHFNPKSWDNWTPPDVALQNAIRAGVPIVGFIGRYTFDKGSNDLLSCRDILLDRGIQHELLIVGPTEGDPPSQNKSVAKKSRPIFVGQVQDVAPYLSVMDILLLPTRREGFPNVALEAAAMCVPVVTTDATGSVDAVVDEETGLIVPVGDVPSLARATARLLKNPKLRHQLGINGRARARSNFESTAVTKKHAAFYRKLAQPKA